MHYTKNYHLPQWEKSDRIMMDDFNAMCGNLEAGLEKTARDASDAAAQAEARASAAAGSAKNAADAAMAAANKAQQSADAAQATADNAYCPGNLPYSVGTYDGNGSSAGTTVTLGYKPQFLIITAQSMRYNSANCATDAIIVGRVGRSSNLPEFVTLLEDGFTVKNQTTDDINYEIYPKMNVRDTRYYYIAFR